MNYIEFGVSIDGELVPADSVPRGQTNLVCPYCAGPLAARRGKIVVPHFTHMGKACRISTECLKRITIPYYRQFGLDLPPSVLAEFHKWPKTEKRGSLVVWDLIQPNSLELYDNWELTQKGELLRGDLSLPLFCHLQEPMLWEKLERLHERARRAKDSNHPDAPLLWTDYRLYQAQLRRLYSSALYLLEIRVPSESRAETFYKIGVTASPIEQRIAEVVAELSPHIATCAVTALDVWESRAHVEFYVKFRFRDQNRKIGTRTEYFDFDDPASVKSELKRMSRRELTKDEQIQLGLLGETEEENDTIQSDETESSSH